MELEPYIVSLSLEIWVLLEYHCNWGCYLSWSVSRVLGCVLTKSRIVVIRFDCLL